MKNLFKIITIFLTISIFVGCGKKKDELTEKKDIIENVKVQKLSGDTIARVLDFSITLKAYKKMNVSPSLSGTIEHIYVDISDKIAKDQLLVRMDQNQLNTAKINFSAIKLELERLAKLKESGSASQQAYDKVKAQYDQLEQTLSFLETNTFFKAPFSGVISAKNYEDGEIYGAQLPILVLSQVNTLKAIVDIPESYFPLVKKGMKVEINSDIYPNKIFTATIKAIYPVIDPTSHNFQVELKIPNAKLLLRPGMFARVRMELGKEKTITVPSQAVLKVQGSNERYVFVNDNGMAKNIKVKIGQRFDDRVEIISDEIKEGDEIVIAGQTRLNDRVKLNIIK